MANNKQAPFQHVYTIVFSSHMSKFVERFIYTRINKVSIHCGNIKISFMLK